jgi:hypothetical protein
MSNTIEKTSNPFASPMTAPLTRWAFVKNILTAGVAFGMGPSVFSNAAKASNSGAAFTGSTLQKMISEQYLAYNNQAVLDVNAQELAVNDERFHDYLGIQLQRLHPASSTDFG